MKNKTQQFIKNIKTIFYKFIGGQSTKVITKSQTIEYYTSKDHPLNQLFDMTDYEIELELTKFREDKKRLSK